MREIRFRAWDKAGKCWLQSELVQDFLGVGVPWTEKNEDGVFILWQLNNKRIELMQSTGLLDKNGKEIYEGDIVKGRFMGYIDDDFRTGQVVFAEGGFQFTDKNQQDFYFPVSQLKDHEVLGNIHQNKDLL